MRAALVAGGMLLLALSLPPPARAGVATACDVDDVAASFESFPLCQFDGSGYLGENIIIRLTGMPGGWFFYAATLIDGNGRSHPFGDPSVVRNGQVTRDRRIPGDGRMVLNGRVPSGTYLPGGRVTLRITLQDRTRDSEGKPFFGGSYWIEPREAPFTVLAGPRRRQMGDERFECEGPAPRRCYAGGWFEFTGGPYTEVLIATTFHILFRPVPRVSMDVYPRPQITVRPDQIVRYPRDKARLPTEVGTYKAIVFGQQNWQRELATVEIIPHPVAAPPPAPAPGSQRVVLQIELKTRTPPRGYAGQFPAGEREAVPGTELRFALSAPEVTGPRPGPFDVLLDGATLSSAAGWSPSVLLPASLADGRHRLTFRATDTGVSTRRYEGDVDVDVVRPPPGPVLRVDGPGESDREIGAVVTNLASSIQLESIAPHALVPNSITRQGTTLRFRFTAPIEKVWDWSMAAPGASRTADSAVTATFTQPLGHEFRVYQYSFTLREPVKVAVVCRHPIAPALVLERTSFSLRSDNTVGLKIGGFPCGDTVSVHAVGEAGQKIDLAGPLRVGPRGNELFEPADAPRSVVAALTTVGARLRPNTPERFEIVVRGASGHEAKQALTVTPASYLEVMPARPKAGERIQVRAFGFQPNVYAHVFLGELRLTPEQGKPLDAGSPLDVKLPDAVAGRQTLRMRDNAGNQAETVLEIEGEGAQACTQPCVQLPPTARQGEPFDAFIGGFLRNEQVVVRFDERFDVGRPYQAEGLIKSPILVPRGVKDGRYRVTATAVSDARRTASASLEIRGGFRAPTLAVACPQRQPGCDVARLTPGETVHTTGEGWAVKGRFTGTLHSDRGGRSTALAREGCVWGMVGGGAVGRPCDEVKGEIDKYWELPADAPTGAHVIEVSDGIATARAGFLVEAPTTRTARATAEAIGPGGPGRAGPGDLVEIRGAGFPPHARLVVRLDQSPLRTDGTPQADATGAFARLYVRVPDAAKPGAHTIEIAPQAAGAAVNVALTVVEPARAPAPPPPPTAPGGKPCDPEMPRIWQPGCVPVAGPPAPSPPPGPVTYCDPEKPRFWQPGCVPRPGGAPAPPKPPQKCLPNVPSYSQPGCIP